jgi:[lysine-biosynthesis-protein LysW]--L-2-aminoadipate ligase
MRIAMLHTRVRVEERMLLDAFAARGITPDVIDLREVILDPSSMGSARWSAYDAVIDRSTSLTASQTIVPALERHGVRCVNPSATIAICADKWRTTLALEAAGVPTPRVRMALDMDSAINALEELGYPSVLKPVVGSWGRMVSRVNDRDAAEAILEHRFTLGGPQHGAVYIQEHIDKPGRDLRVFVIGGQPIAAIARSSAHWLTNTARGAVASGLALDGGNAELTEIAVRAANCVGGDAVAVDLLECPDRGPLVNELNHTMEFRNSVDTTGVDIPGLVADRVIHAARTHTDLDRNPAEPGIPEVVARSSSMAGASA